MAREDAGFSGPDMLYPPVTDGAPSRAIVTAPTYPAPAPVVPGYAPRGPEIIHGGLNQTWLMNCLRRRWLMATLMGLLIGGATAALLLWLFPNVSQVTSYLKVKSQSGNEVFQDTNQRLMPQEIERQAMNHLALLKSPYVLGAALQDQTVIDLDAVKAHKGEEVLWLTDELRVSFPGDGEILEVRYEGEEDAEQMVKVVKAIVKAYQEKVLMEDKLVSSATQADLAAVLRSTKERLQNRLKTLKEKATSAGTLQEEVEIPQLASEIKTLEGLVVAVKKELVDIDVMKELAVNTANSAGALESAVTAELDKDPTIAMYQSKIFELQSAIQQLQSASRNRSSANLKRMLATLEQTQSDMEQYRMGAMKAARDRLAKMPNDVLRATLIEHDVRFKAASENLKEYENQLKTARDKLLSLGVQDPEMEILKQDIENETEIVKSLEQKVLEWEVIQKARERQENKASDLEKVSVIQEATAVPDINTIERWSIAGIGGAAALALTCYGIALLEFRRRRLNNPTDIDEGLGVRVLGVLPPTSLKALTGNSLVATQVAEAIDNVRATLMHDSTSAPRQVVMVTSSGTMEGNTVVASSLALSLSRAGRRTLLVDGDLRAPALHKLFGMGLEDGLSEVLRSEIDVADAVRPTNNEGLYLLTAGVCSSEAIQALATDQPQVIFEKLRDQFDFIVIDAPPVLGISDSLSLGQYIDGAVLTVLRDHSEIRNVHKAVELLKSMDIRLIGAVVNGVPIKADRRVVRLHQASQRTPRLPASADH